VDTEVADMAEATVEEDTDMADMVGAMVVTVAMVTGNKYYKRGTRYLLLGLFNRVLNLIFNTNLITSRKKI
jgi:hypothetical protein